MDWHEYIYSFTKRYKRQQSIKAVLNMSFIFVENIVPTRLQQLGSFCKSSITNSKSALLSCISWFVKALFYFIDEKTSTERQRD